MKRLLCLLTIVFVLTSCSFSNYSDGFRVGTITKFSKKGFVFKTWEGEMNLGGYRPGGNGAVVANLWQFSIDGHAQRGEDTAKIVSLLTQAAETGLPVKVYYKQDITFFQCSRGSTFSFVQSVEPLVPRKEF